MIKKDEFIYDVKKRLANISIGPSAIRNQGAPGIVAISRDYFIRSINLVSFFDSLNNQNRFDKYLNRNTMKLLNEFPKAGKSWGAARKGLNLYFRELVYNKFIAEHYKLPVSRLEFDSLISPLEVPLDKDVAAGIKIDAMKLDISLPSWPRIISLTPEVSAEYQNAALRIANNKKIARVHLDLTYWRNKSI